MKALLSLLAVLAFSFMSSNMVVASDALPGDNPEVAAVAEQDQPAEKETGEKTPGDEAVPEEETGEEVSEIADPLYPWNNAMYHFNDKLYFWFLKPTTQAYSFVVPEDFRIAVKNFFDNITAPIRIVNNLLQGKFKNAGNEVVRFVVNSTIGIGGLGDAARTELGIKEHDEDFGQTLSTYGVGTGFYVIWPFIGPSSARDTVGLVVDRFLNPATYVNPWEAAAGIKFYGVVNQTSFRIGDYEDLKEAAVDPYVSIRDAYVQNRKKEAAQ